MKNKKILKWATVAYVAGGLAISLCIYTIAIYTEGIKIGKLEQIQLDWHNTHPTTTDVQAEIIRQATLFGVDVNLALKIADCESEYIWDAKNPISTARGVYQYVIGTWDATLSAKQGLERNDWKANIREAMIDLANGEYSHWIDCLNN